jgi:hypothetical protein
VSLIRDLSPNPTTKVIQQMFLAKMTIHKYKMITNDPAPKK